jgi:hypothetical protein
VVDGLREEPFGNTSQQAMADAVEAANRAAKPDE